jgi:gamma-glutamyltranspeptidase
MCPLILTRGGKPVLASSAIGGGLHQRNVQVLASILEFDMEAQAAVNAPAFLLPEWSAAKCVAQVGEGSFDAGMLDGVRRLGQEVKVLRSEESEAFASDWAGIQVEPMTGRLQAAGTSGLPGHARSGGE